MSRIVRVLLLVIALIFMLACNAVTQPFNDAQQVVETVQSIATAMPIETLKALPSAIPVETLQAIPSEIPDFGNAVDPQGEPLTEWNGIPIHPSAFSGEETSGIYSYKANATVKEVFDYYESELVNRGWSELFNVSDTGSGALLTYEQGSHTATITVTSDTDGVVLVFVTYQ